MATAFTLTTLTAVAQNRMEDQGTDFAAELPTLIKNAEDRVLVDLGLEIFDSTGTLTFSNGSRFATLPSNTIAVRQAYFSSGGSTVFMDQRTQSYILDYDPAATAGTPRFWAPYDETTIMVGPVPGASPSTGSVLTIKRPNSLNTDTGGTWLSNNCGTLLEMALLKESAQYLKKPQAVTAYEADYKTYLAAARMEFRHLIRADYAPVAATPTPKAER